MSDEIRVGRDRDGNALYVSAEIRTQGGTWQTTDHETVTDPTELALQGVVIRKGGSYRRDGDWLSAGQIDTDLLRDATPAEGWTADDLRKLADIWDRWHLNAMRAGCVHQTQVVYEDGKYDRQVDLDATTAANECPAGYRYGSAWLAERVPNDVLAWVRERFATVNA